MKKKNWKRKGSHLLLGLIMMVHPLRPDVIHGTDTEAVDGEVTLAVNEDEGILDAGTDDVSPDEGIGLVVDDAALDPEVPDETTEWISTDEEEQRRLLERGQALEDALAEVDLDQLVESLNEQDYAHLNGFVLFNINGEQLPSPRTHVVRHQRFLGTPENSRYFFRHVPGFWSTPTNQGNGWRMQTWQINIGGVWVRAFCTQPGVSSAEPGHNYLPNWNPSFVGLSQIQRETIGAILTHGYRHFHRPPASNVANWGLDARSSDDALIVTQIMIQEVAAGHWNLNTITPGERSPINGQGVYGDPWRRLIANAATSNGMQGGPTWQVAQGIGGAFFHPQPAVGNTRRMEMYDAIRHDVYFFHRRRNAPRGTRRIDQPMNAAATHTLTWSDAHHMYRVEIDDRLSTGGTGTLRRFMGERTSGELGGGYRFCRGTQTNGVCQSNVHANRLWIYTTHSNAPPFDSSRHFLHFHPTADGQRPVTFFAHPIYQNKVVGQQQVSFEAHFRVQVQPRIPPEISILKRSSTPGSPALAGAIFRIRRLTAAGDWREAEANHVVILGGSAVSGSTTRRMTGADGRLRFTRLSFGGQYEICEISPPVSYQLAMNPCHTFTSGTGSGTVHGPRIFTNDRIPRQVVASHLNVNDHHEVLGINEVLRPGTRSDWWDGDAIQGASSSRRFPRVMPTGQMRFWRYEPSQTIGNQAIVNGNMTVIHHYSRPVLVRIRHMDRETNEIILTEIKNNLYEGDRLPPVCPSHTLTSLAGYWVMSEDDCVAIPRLTGDVDIDFLYETPTLILNVERLEITTGQTEMPAELIVSREVIHEGHLHTDIEYRLVLTHEKTGYQTVLPWRSWEGDDWQSDNRHKEVFALSTDGLPLGAVSNIRVNIEIRNNPMDRPNRFETQSQNLITQGYRSSERVITAADVIHGTAIYEGVARTIAIRNQERFEVTRRMETLSIHDFVDSVRQRTGYGIEINLTPTFQSEIGDVLGVNGQPDLQVHLVAPASLVEIDVDETFKQLSESHRSIGLDVVHRRVSGASTRTTALELSHPQMWVQRGAGELFTEVQVTDHHPAIYDLLRDGGRRFYIPIWHDLGVYTLNFQSETGVGRHLISLDVDWQLDIFAFMYAWVGSPSIEADKLLMQPILSDTQTPAGWNEAQIQWLRGYLSIEEANAASR